MLLTRVKTFLKSALNGNETISADLREQFMEDCGAALDKQFAPRQEWRLRMSSVGQLPCKQHLAKDGIKEELEYDAFMRFIFGDMVEALAVCVMKAAGIPVEDEQKKVSLQVYDTKLDGSMDLTIDGEVWDVKSASPFSFSSKFGDYGGYTKLKNDDPFGYVVQGHSYGKANGTRFAGWIAINKSTGEWAFTTTPKDGGIEEKEALTLAALNIKSVKDGKYKRLPDEKETYTKKKVKIETGNRVLGNDCVFCGYKGHCWPDAVLAPKATSEANNPPLTWYTELKYPVVNK